ncbi:ABC transporter ATP-binding protein [Methylococcus capsulatus]|jgi:phospholipid/cholesterol/gamma-HCH transport system ATP-binding protein|uniref:Phospholipid/cholesterol/gamma-HCH transport system ATP-binding protein n=1 Tax=Methylococcus capsulatus TaxID=414 RepID=A0AA35Y080_METCP|nr:ATP-binding cassette domain-containing protein [Methylococcus capsulatus]CAI8781047.1 phospholipid/cholesterol/gamma-HCH transport system ATP-binding protein [Methylococcus capsulatus]
MTDDEVIHMEHVWTRFGENLVHRDISLSLGRGQILGVVGASGCGKTVLMREMIGLQTPTQGQVWLLGESLAEADARRKQQLRNRCGVLFQGGALFSALSVFDNIAFPLRELKTLDEELIARLVCMKLAMVGLGETDALLMPAELSGGMVKRAALARALIMEPEVLFLDEPTSGLDPVLGEEFVGLLGQLHRELGFTVVMVTHDLDTLSDLCTCVAVLAGQQLVSYGTLDDAIACAHPFARDFFHGKRAQRILGRSD